MVAQVGAERRSGVTAPIHDPWPAIGLAAVLVLTAAALAVPGLFGWSVHAGGIAPLAARWQPRFGPGTVPAVVLGAAVVRWGLRVAATSPWPRMMLLAFATSVAWLTCLATVDGWSGINKPLDHASEYLRTARDVTDVSAMLHSYIARIPLHSAGHWPVQVAGHPPGALLFFVLLDRLGLGSGPAAGWTVLVLAATTPVAVLLTLRRLGAEVAARRVAPILVVGPAAVWMAVSGDALFGAVAAWGLYLVAVSASSLRGRRVAGTGLVAGLLLGYCLLLSYGLPLLAVLALAILLVARSVRPLPWVAAGALIVMLTFAAAGFVWWDAFPVLRARYYAGIAAVRPAGYWGWGDLAALCLSAGLVLGPATAAVLHRVRDRGFGGGEQRAALLLPVAALLCVGAADLSFMSKAEVERIWLPFVPWLLIGAALLPERWRRRALVGQVCLALTIQSLLITPW